MTTTTLYAVSIEQRGADLYIELRCETCDEVRRFYLDDDQLGAVATIAAPLTSKALRDVAATQAGAIVPDLVRSIVWQLTHTTCHTEQARRDATREGTHDAN